MRQWVRAFRRGVSNMAAIPLIVGLLILAGALYLVYKLGE